MRKGTAFDNLAHERPSAGAAVEASSLWHFLLYLARNPLTPLSRCRLSM